MAVGSPDGCSCFGYGTRQHLAKSGAPALIAPASLLLGIPCHRPRNSPAAHEGTKGPVAAETNCYHLVASNNRNMFYHSSGGQKSKVSITGLKPRAGSAVFPWGTGLGEVHNTRTHRDTERAVYQKHCHKPRNTCPPRIGKWQGRIHLQSFQRERGLQNSEDRFLML